VPASHHCRGEAQVRGWVVASIKDDWKRVFAFDK